MKPIFTSHHITNYTVGAYMAKLLISDNEVSHCFCLACSIREGIRCAPGTLSKTPKTSSIASLHSHHQRSSTFFRAQALTRL